MSAAAHSVTIPRDLERILALPKRSIVDCSRERGSHRWNPAAQALVEIVTAKYTRGPRLSCGCQTRHVTATVNGGLVVFHESLAHDAPPPPPITTTIDAFCADNTHNADICRLVGNLRVGESAKLEGLGYPCITEFNPLQAWALWEMPRADGLLGLAGVGSGKSILGIMAPLAFDNCKLAVLLAEPSQRLHYRNFYLRLREHFRVPTIVFDTDNMDGCLVVSGTPPLHFRPYTLLSNHKSTAMLDQLSPDLIIADECFPHAAKILTDRGLFSIGEIVNSKARVNVVSKSIDGKLEYKPIVRWLKKQLPNRLIRIVHEQGSFVCTPEHKVWTFDGGYIRADRLVGKELCAMSEKVFPDRKGKDILFSGLSRTYYTRDCGQDMSVLPNSLSDAEARQSNIEILFFELCAEARKGDSGIQVGKEFSDEAVLQRSPGVEREARGGAQKASYSKNMSKLQSEFFSTLNRENDLDLLLKEMCFQLGEKVSGDLKGIDRQERSGSFCAHESEQSGAHARSSGKDHSRIQGSDIPFARRERYANKTSRDAGDMSRLADGVSNTDCSSKRAIHISTFLLQSGLRRPYNQDSNRSGRSHTQVEEVEVFGQEKNLSSKRSRVVSVEILERGSDGRFEQCIGEDHALYDLEIADNHNYFADGVLVSNCHRISRRENSNTDRVMRFFASHNGTRLCAWSGTLMKKSVNDVSHLAAFALGMKSPLPLDKNEAKDWAAVLDPTPNPDQISSTARDLRRAFGGDMRVGFQARMSQTLGVVSSRGSSAGAAIYLHERKAPPIPEVVREALSGVRNEMIRPDGEELVESFEIARCAREVAAGFHYYWHYREYAAADTDAERAKIAMKIEMWFMWRKAFHKQLRVKLENRSAHLDSPMLCRNAAERAWADPPYDGELPIWKADTWPSWRDIKDKVEHESRTAWIGDKTPEAANDATHPGYFLARDAAAWAKEHRGIVWYLNTAFGHKVAELAGLPCHGGGPDAEKNIMAETGKRSIVASIKAHGSGRDSLQHKFHKQLIAEVPSSNAIWEQLLGRLCRQGQREDAVESWIYLHVHESKDALRAAIREAEFVEQSTGNQQLLLVCDRNFAL